jgi:hypothetical protein
MQEKFAVWPAVGSHHDGVTDRDGPRRFGDYLGGARRVSKLRVVRKRNSVHDQDPDPRRISHSGAFCVGALTVGKRYTVLKNKRFLLGSPLAGERGEAFEVFLVDHTGGVVSSLKQTLCKPKAAGGEIVSEFV